MEIHVLQGERDMAADNISLGRFMLTGILPAPRGVPQIEVTFDIDANGIINVTAKDLGTGRSRPPSPSPASTKLSKDEIEKMVKNAEQFADEDKTQREKVETTNQADQLVYTTEKALQELGAQVTNEERVKVEKAVSDLKDEIKKGDTASIKAKMDALSKEFYAISTRIYQNVQHQQQQQQQQQQAPGGQQNPDGSVDAEYKIIDDDDKK